MEVLSFEVTGKPAASNIFVFVDSMGSTTIGSRAKVGILGDPHLRLNSLFFFRDAFRLPKKFKFPGKRWCRQIHLPHATVLHSSTRHVSSCASEYTEHQHKFSLTCLSCVAVPLRPQTCFPCIHLPTVKIHGRMALLRSSTPPHAKSFNDTGVVVVRGKTSCVPSLFLPCTAARASPRMHLNSAVRVSASLADPTFY